MNALGWQHFPTCVGEELLARLRADVDALGHGAHTHVIGRGAAFLPPLDSSLLPRRR